MLTNKNIIEQKYDNLSIRLLDKKDLELITKLYNENFHSLYTLSEVTKAYENENNIFVGAYTKYELVGFMRIRSNTKEYFKEDKDLFKLIDKKYCTFLSDLISISKGVGSTLIKYLIEECSKFDTDLFTTPFTKDLIKYYERFRFKFISLDRRKLMKYDSDNFTLLTVFGEAHFHKDDVGRIQKETIRIKPDVIISELDDDDLIYKKSLHNIKILRLENNLDSNIFENYKNDLVKQFEIRETNMINNIKLALKDNPNKHIVIVVGDTHLRTLSVKELGTPILRNYLDSLIQQNYLKDNKDIVVNIVRSKYPEIR